MATYAEKLRDPRWQKLRLEILTRDEWKCLRCGDGSKSLHVHHGYYARQTDPWDYDPTLLFTFCEECHEEIQDDLECVHMLIADLWPHFDELSDLLRELLRTQRRGGSVNSDIRSILDAYQLRRKLLSENQRS